MKDIRMNFTKEDLKQWLVNNDCEVKEATDRFGEHAILTDISRIEEDDDEMDIMIYHTANFSFEKLLNHAEEELDSISINSNIDDINLADAGDNFMVEYTNYNLDDDPIFKFFIEICPNIQKTETFGNGHGYEFNFTVVDDGEDD